MLQQLQAHSTIFQACCLASNLAPPSAPLFVAQDVLQQLRPLDREQFTTLLTNFMLGLRGKFKVPTFAHTELDLHRVRGGGLFARVSVYLGNVFSS